MYREPAESFVDYVERAIIMAEHHVTTFLIATEDPNVRRKQGPNADSVLPMLQRRLDNLRSIRSTLYKLEAGPDVLAEAQGPEVSGQ